VGLYVWHDTDRAGFWRFHLKSDSESVAVLSLSLSFNGPVPLNMIVGLDETDYERTGKHKFRIPLGKQLVGRTFGLAVQGFIGVQLKLRLNAPSGTQLPSLFVGPDWSQSTSESISLWKSDPHGIAWVQAEGSPEPELYIARGGLAGKLMPPHDPKTDFFYVWQGNNSTLYRMAAEGVIPSDYGRGRKVEWVDVNNDGVNELYLGNTHSPNSLLIRDPESGSYQDLASRLGLGFVCGESFAWMDWDEDGFQDLIFICGDRLALAHNMGGSNFEFIDGKSLGLDPPKFPSESERRLDNQCIFRILDVDNDGRLDLWLGGCEPAKANQLFRRKGEGFVEVTEDVKLNKIAGTNLLLILDVDNDGFVDAVSVGEEILLLRNIQGTHFAPERLDVGWNLVKIRAASAGDFDGDGTIDLVLVGSSRYLVHNLAGGQNGHVMAHFGSSIMEPIGAVVRAHFSDGTIQAQRYGSARNSRLSQVLQPLHFGVPPATSISAVGVRWPGSTEEVLYPVAPGQTSLRLKR
jgi:hypothetical protein